MGGLKKLKKESEGLTTLTTRVRLVAARGAEADQLWQPVCWRTLLKRTLVALLLDLDLARQVLVLLPDNLGALSPVIDEVAAVADLLLVVVDLLELRVLKVVVRVKDEGQLEAGLGGLEVRELDVA